MIRITKERTLFLSYFLKFSFDIVSRLYSKADVMTFLFLKICLIFLSLKFSMNIANVYQDCQCKLWAPLYHSLKTKYSILSAKQTNTSFSLLISSINHHFYVTLGIGSGIVTLYISCSKSYFLFFYSRDPLRTMSMGLSMLPSKRYLIRKGREDTD